MKILYINYSEAIWGGIEKVTIFKMNYFVNHYGYDVYLLTADQGDHPFPFKLDDRIHYEDLGIHSYIQYRYKGFRRYWERYVRKKLLYTKLSEKIHQIQPNIILCSNPYYIPVLVSIKGNIPLIAESHSGYDHLLEFDMMTWRRRLQTKMLLKKLRGADVLVALTQSDAIKWKKDHSNVMVIPNVVNLNQTGYYSSYNNKRVIFVGRHSKQKAIPDLLNIWSSVHESHPDWELDMYVEGFNTEFTKSIEALNANINLYSPVSNIMNRYIESSILVLTSLYEPFGLVIVEAMSCGLPVVSFEGDGPCLIINDGKNGYLIKNRNMEEFANKLCCLIEDINLRQHLGQSAIISSMNYSSDKIMPKWKDLFDSLTS